MYLNNFKERRLSIRERLPNHNLSALACKTLPQNTTKNGLNPLSMGSSLPTGGGPVLVVSKKLIPLYRVVVLGSFSELW